MNMIPVSSQSITIGQLASDYTASNVLNDYRQRVAKNTLKRQEDDIKLFSQFLKHDKG